MNAIRPKVARLRLNPMSCKNLRQRVLRRDGWRCQSCGTMFARELAKERIRREYPEWSDAQVARELFRLTLLPALVPARLR